MTPVTWIRTRLSGRADTEHEQAILRMLMGIAFAFYLLPDATKHSTEWVYAATVMVAAYIVAALGIIVCILVWPQLSPARRVI